MAVAAYRSARAGASAMALVARSITACGSRSMSSSAAATHSSRVLSNDVRSDFTDIVGNTPLIRLRGLSAATGANVLAKAEWMNAGGSVKDRAAHFLVRDAEARGVLKPGGTVVEGTAGNTGIGLAHVCAARGYKLIIYMPNTQSQEKIDLLRFLGATVVPVPAVPLNDPSHYTFQARDHAASLANAVWTNQFDNVANAAGHYASTGPEIWTQTGGKIDGFTCATGTGGTLAGTGKYLKEVSGGRVKVFLADPPGSVLYSYVKSKGARMERVGSSVTEGIGQGRVTDNLKDVVHTFDDALYIEDARTITMVFRLLKDEGIYVGASSALNAVAAGDMARALGPGSTVVTMLCDGAYRYQARLFSATWLKSKGLFDAVPADCKHLVTLA